jgi:hypothetical protein
VRESMPGVRSKEGPVQDAAVVAVLGPCLHSGRLEQHGTVAGIIDLLGSASTVLCMEVVQAS